MHEGSVSGAAPRGAAGTAAAADRIDGDFAPTHDAAALTAGGRQARIRLDDKEYVLRITRAGKLILTK